jgi:ABC-type glycerol-3-phosphate transport system substrate-binding protein
MPPGNYKLSTSKQGWGIGILAGIALVYLTMFALLSKRPQEHVTEFYFADRMTEAHRILIDQYNKLHEGKVKVIPIDFPNEDFSSDTRKEILARSLRGEDDGIDLLAVDVIWVQRFAKWCEPLGKYFTDEERRRITPTALGSCYLEGDLLAVPLDQVQSVIYYRSDLLAKEPNGKELLKRVQTEMSWADFLKIQKEVTPSKNPFYIYPAADYEGLICCYMEILLSQEPDYFSTVGYRFDTPEAKNALRLLVDMVHQEHATPDIVSNFTEVPSYDYFIKHDGLFLHGWTSYDQDFKEAPVDSAKESELKKMPVPYYSGGRPASVFGGWNLMVSKASEKKEAVVDFIKYLLSDQSQEIFYVKGGYYPIVNSFYSDSSYMRKYPEIASIKKLMKLGVHRPSQEEYTKDSKIMSRYFSLAIKGKLTVDEALKSVDASIESERSLMP